MKTKRKEWLIAIVLTMATGCGTMRSVMGTDMERDRAKPISNPFAFYNPETQKSSGDTMVLRSKHGDGAVEVEIPNSGQNVSDFVIPITSETKNKYRAPASLAEEAPAAQADMTQDDSYVTREPSLSDREITRTFPQNRVEDEAHRREIEQDLGLVRAEDMTPEKQKSYLAALDHVKRLYRKGRYEAALLEVDGLVREYPTNPKLYEMRGTLLDRVGQPELALKAWKQALRFDAKNESLRRFVERKEQKRSLASP